MCAWVLNVLSLVKVHLCGSAILATQAARPTLAGEWGWGQPCHHHLGAPGLLCTHRHQLHTDTVSWLCVKDGDHSWEVPEEGDAPLPGHLTWNAHVRWPQAAWALWVSCLCPWTLHTRHSWQLSRFTSSDGDGCYSAEITMTQILTVPWCLWAGWGTNFPSYGVTVVSWRPDTREPPYTNHPIRWQVLTTTKYLDTEDR